MVASNGTEALAYVKDENRDKIIGKTLTVNGRQCIVTSEFFLGALVPVEEAFDEYALFVGCLQRGEWVYAVSLNDAWEVAETEGIAELVARKRLEEKS